MRIGDFFSVERIHMFTVTTAIEQQEALVESAQQIAKDFRMPYVERKKATLSTLRKAYGDLFVVYKDKLTYVYANGETLFFHPDTAMVRLKQQKEPLATIIGSAPKRIIDATMGMAGDSIVLSGLGHSVIALESQSIIYTIVSNGLKRYVSGYPVLDDAMRRIITVHTAALDYLTQQEDASVDIVYFDPMFSHCIEESDNLNGIKPLANYAQITTELMHQAKRVAKEKVIVKAHYKDPVFETFQLKRDKRKHALFHFGFMDCENDSFVL